MVERERELKIMVEDTSARLAVEVGQCQREVQGL
jgi:hypothetical protein